MEIVEERMHSYDSRLLTKTEERATGFRVSPVGTSVALWSTFCVNTSRVCLSLQSFKEDVLLIPTYQVSL